MGRKSGRRDPTQDPDQEDEELGQASAELEFEPRRELGLLVEVHHHLFAGLGRTATEGRLRKDPPRLLHDALQVSICSSHPSVRSMRNQTRPLMLAIGPATDDHIRFFFYLFDKEI